ncbi:exo-beta-N-acetylmuramidase NamZ domain-containing protein [Acidithiobacillus sp.]
MFRHHGGSRVAAWAMIWKETAWALVLSALLCMGILPAQAGSDPERLHQGDLSGIAQIVQKEIQSGRIPGAVIVVGNDDRIVYRKAFGYAALGPEKIPMTVGTLFDLASLTKVVATTTAVMQLVEQGKLELDAPVAKYWPAFGENGKDAITVRELLTHYSGLPPDLNLEKPWSGYDAALRLIIAQRPVNAPGTRYVYSDINFEALGEIVHQVSGEPLDVYCAEHIFRPLGMRESTFHPPSWERYRIAPTEYMDGKLRWGEVHDPTAYRMGGVSGHAGLFSTAGDLAIFAQTLLHGGSRHGVRILDRRSVERMTIPQSPPGKVRLRGLGWDLAAPLAVNRDDLLPVGAYDHTGFTGTFLWIDPLSRTYVIILTNRVYPFGKGNAGPLRKAVISLVSSRLGPLTDGEVAASRPLLARYYAQVNEPYGVGTVQTGVDVLEAERFAPLKGLRVGLITNQTGLDVNGNRTVDLLSRAPGMKLVAIFSPEHGLYGDSDEKVASGMEPSLGLPVYSLYGNVRRPTGDMLRGIDALVFDVQDAGARFYTYITTMAYAMEAAAKHGIPFYVLDRPDPIGANVVQGPVLDADLESFTGYFPLPVRYGMTIGELAEMFNAEDQIGAKLHVIHMRGYKRSDWYDQTGLRWVAPSPNLRTLTEATLYPGVGLVEGANVSVGRGTDTPFELVGAPWIEAGRLAEFLSARDIPGVRFVPVVFTPSASRYQGRRCHGVRIVLTDRHALNAAALGVEIASALTRLYPEKFQTRRILGMVGARWVLEAIQRGEDPRLIVAQWRSSLQDFERLRSRYLLY